MSGKVINITVGMKGVVIATAPFDVVINPRLIQQCIAVKTINGLLAEGFEPYTDIYERFGISEDQFNIDADSNVRIITFQDATGEINYVPEIYIQSLPDANGVPYRCVMLGISLSAIPDNMDVSDLKTELSDIIFNYLGVRSEVKEVVYGEPSILSQEEHAAVEQARVTNITNNVSSRLRVSQLESTTADLYQKIQVLETFIKDNIILP
jgi:hypothetical protein